MVVPAYENKCTPKKCEELWTKLRYRIRSNNNSDDFDEKYRKLKFYANDDLAIKEPLEFIYIINVKYNLS